MRYLLAVLILLSFPCFGFDQHFEYANYEKAEEAESFIRFDMESTKLGVITTEFSGFVKKFDIHNEIDHSGAKNLVVTFKVKNLDTDSDGRNEKMWGLCFDSDKYPEMKVEFPRKIFLKKKSYRDEDAFLYIRGKKYQIKVSFILKNEGEDLLVSGGSKLSLKELNIPDPSIAIASVNDEVHVGFKLRLKNFHSVGKTGLRENKLEVRSDFLARTFGK